MAHEERAAQPLVCARHPQEETYLSCSRCGEPVCHRCMVHADVGIRCPACARPHPMPPYDPSLRHLLAAGALGAGLALMGAGLWAYLSVLFFPFGLLLLVSLGFGLGNLISLAASRKRGRSLQIISGSSVVLGYILAIGLNPFLATPLPLFALLLTIVAATSSLR